MSNQQAPTLGVIGGGAAGFFCAVNAARMRPGLQVTILEKSSKILSKVSVSGGGRCNVTHACFDIAEMVKKYPRGQHFLKKSFGLFFTPDTIQWFKERGVPLKAEVDGRLFPVTDDAQTIIDCLVREANRYEVKVFTRHEVVNLERVADRWRVQLRDGRPLFFDFACVACGGYPKPEQFQWLQALGHAVTKPAPSLFTFNIPQHPITSLQGIALTQTVVRIPGTRLQESGPLLITHWGLSGPVVLRLSAWGARLLQEREYDFSIQVNWLPAFHEQSMLVRLQALRFEWAAQKIYNKNPWGLPQRLWEFLLKQAMIADHIRWADLPAHQQNRLAKLLVAQELPVKGKTIFKEEFVTCGGIKLSQVNPHSMESRLLPRLYFAGEILDVDGVTGGFNFQHAWTSGWIAARAVAQACALF